MDERGLCAGNPPDVDVELPSFNHAEGLLLLRVHVLQVLGELLRGNRNGAIGRRLFEDDGPAFAPAALRADERRENESEDYNNCVPSHGLSLEVELNADLGQLDKQDAPRRRTAR